MEEGADMQEWEMIVSELSSNETYFLIHDKQRNKKGEYYVLVYPVHNKDLKFEQLLKQYARERKIKSSQILIFKLQGSESIIDKNLTVDQVKRKSRKRYLDGSRLIAEYPDQIYLDECSLETLNLNDRDLNSGIIEVPFQVKGHQKLMYVPISVCLNDQQVIAQVQGQIHHTYGKKLSKADFDLEYKTDGATSFAQLTEKDRVEVILSPGIELREPPVDQGKEIILEGEGVKPRSFVYESLRDRKVLDVISELEKRDNWEEYALKVGDIFIRPNEKLDRAEVLFKKAGHSQVKVIAQVIKEYHLFKALKKTVQDIGQATYTILNGVLKEDEKNRKHREVCRNKTRERALKTKNKDFRNNEQMVEPILLYTSSLMVVDDDKNSATLYKTLNDFLRLQVFTTADEASYRRWEYKFAYELWDKLELLNPLDTKVLWRGVGYVPSHSIGEIINFKSFISTSTSQKQAGKFAKKALYKIPKSFNGRLIRDYSYYQTEDEVLFPPYSEFVVTDIVEDYKSDAVKEPVRCYVIEEVKKRELTVAKTMMVLWVDDNPKQIQKIWDDLEVTGKSAVMIPFVSTEQLVKWMTKNAKVLEDQTAQFILITNMTRWDEEEDENDEYAGVKTIEAFRKLKPNGPCLVYSWWVEGVVKKLEKHRLQVCDRLGVSDKPSEVKEFMKKFGLAE